MRATLVLALAAGCCSAALLGCGQKQGAPSANGSHAICDATHTEGCGGGEGSAAAPSAPNPPRTYGAGETFDDCGGATWCPRMVVIPAGSFLAGPSPTDPNRDSYDGPQRQVTIRSFALGRYEITSEQWRACVAGGYCPDKPRGDGVDADKLPVLRVSWEDVQKYLQWLSQRTGQTYRLPSETEWEYAARAGTTTVYSTGDTLTKAQANVYVSGQEGYGGPRPVGSYAPNPFGLFDMNGNVEEYVADCYADISRRQPVNGDAYHVDNCSLRTVRGGWWGGDALAATSAFRFYQQSFVGEDGSGFRVARSIP